MDQEKSADVGYFGILPASVRYDNELTFFERLLYVEITSLTRKDGYCWASNDFLGKLLDRSKSATSKAITNLEEQGHITVQLLENNRRRIFLSDPIHKRQGGYSKTARGVAENEQGASQKLPHTNKNQQDKPKREIKTVDEQADKIANDLLESVKANFPFTKSDPKKWAAEVEKIHRLDGFEYQLIEAVAKWSQQDTFWQGNIRSGANLRKHFETLLVRIKQEQQKKVSNGLIDADAIIEANERAVV